MSLMGFLVLLVIAAIAGAIGQAIAGYSAGGCLFTVAIGFVGAYLGSWLAGQLGLPAIFTVVIDGQPFPIVWAIIGSAILALIAGSLSRSRRRGRRAYR
ncbi:MAG TPA: hypothetical protein VGJ97_11485 [Anaerolineaceae bacterium]|jgi:uncharacterized membrane protein YeaQ/YmgE (transglycosylase-associated protein family)